MLSTCSIYNMHVCLILLNKLCILMIFANIITEIAPNYPDFI